MKQLFLKSNILHIRTNEGVFEVSNPEIIGDPETIKIIFNDGKPFGGVPIEPVWPGGVEFETIAPHPECNKARECLQLTNGLNCSQAYDARTRSTSLCAKAYKIARLLPKEEKKHEWTTDEFMSMVENKEEKKDDQPMSFTESAYKEFEKFDLNKNNVPTIATDRTEVESPEPQEKMSYWQYQQFAEAVITQLKDRNEKLESENKALREEISQLKAKLNV